MCPHLGCAIGWDAAAKQLPVPVPRQPVRRRRRAADRAGRARPRSAAGRRSSTAGCSSPGSATSSGARRGSRREARRVPARARRGSGTATPKMPTGASFAYVFGAVLAVPARGRGRHRVAARDVLQPVGDRRLGLGRVHPGSGAGRLAGARPPSSRRLGDRDRRRDRTSCRPRSAGAYKRAARAGVVARPAAARRSCSRGRSPATGCAGIRPAFYAAQVELGIAASTPIVGGAIKSFMHRRQRLRQPHADPRLRGST